MIISRRKLLISAATLALLLGVASSPQLLGAHVASAFESLRGAERHWLLVAAVGFVAAFGCTVGAWRAALGAAGGRVCPRRAAAGLGVGAMVNSFAPAKLGDAVKIALFSKAIDAPGRLWTAGGIYAALAAARSLMLAALLVVASATGAMPLWPALPCAGSSPRSLWPPPSRGACAVTRGSPRCSPASQRSSVRRARSRRCSAGRRPWCLRASERRWPSPRRSTSRTRCWPRS